MLVCVVVVSDVEMLGFMCRLIVVYCGLCVLLSVLSMVVVIVNMFGLFDDMIVMCWFLVVSLNVWCVCCIFL